MNKQINDDDFVTKGASRKYIPRLEKYYKNRIGQNFAFEKDIQLSDLLKSLYPKEHIQKIEAATPKKGEVWTLIEYRPFIGIAGCFGGDAYLEDTLIIKRILDGQEKEVAVSEFYMNTKEEK